MSNMTPETIQAIHDSIQHWCRMRSDPIGCREEPYTDHCALCKLFYSKRCDGCPVAERTGLRECAGSPWRIASIKWSMVNRAECVHNMLLWHLAANAEIAFLNSLLPQNGAAQQPTNT